MKLRMAIGPVLGALACVMLVRHYGVAAVMGALRIAGWRGLAAVALFHLLPLSLCALAWRAQLRRAPVGFGRYVGFRLMRDAGGDLLGMLPGSGQILGIRAMGLAGIEVSLAAASSVVDATLEMSAQVVFALAGVTILIVKRPGGAPVGWALVGVGVLAVLLTSFALAQRFGPFRLLERFAERLAAERGWAKFARAVGIQDRIHRIYADRGCVLRAFCVHLLAWFVGIGEAGLALYLLGFPVSLSTLVALESLSYALRGAAFFVPAGLGVQEGGYVVLGALFGISPQTALALSILKRGRELLLGSIGLAVWQAAEGARKLAARPEPTAAEPVPVTRAEDPARARGRAPP